MLAEYFFIYFLRLSAITKHVPLIQIFGETRFEIGFRDYKRRRRSWFNITNSKKSAEITMCVQSKQFYTEHNKRNNKQVTTAATS